MASSLCHHAFAQLAPCVWSLLSFCTDCTVMSAGFAVWQCLFTEAACLFVSPPFFGGSIKTPRHHASTRWGAPAGQHEPCVLAAGTPAGWSALCRPAPSAQPPSAHARPASTDGQRLAVNDAVSVDSCHNKGCTDERGLYRLLVQPFCSRDKSRPARHICAHGSAFSARMHQER